MSSISCLVAQVTVMLDKYACRFLQAFSVSDFSTDSEPNACGGFLMRSESVFNVGNLL